MIVIQLTGGMGNQLFQYAAARHLTAKKNERLKLDLSFFESQPLRKYRLSHFNIEADVASKAELRYFTGASLPGKLTRWLERHFLPVTRRRIYREPREFVFDPTLLELQNQVMIQGYFQNVSYFQPIESLIRHELTISTPVDSVNQAFIERIQSVNSISLHIRRGDYASNPTTRAFHGLIPLDYYYTAATSIAARIPEPHFFVFSDDVAWARENLRLSEPMIFVDHNNDERDYEDLRLMSHCKHHIIANSSFSWWGAWLSNHSDKIVYAPRQWTAGSGIDSKSFSPSAWQFS